MITIKQRGLTALRAAIAWQCARLDEKVREVIRSVTEEHPEIRSFEVTGYHSEPGRKLVHVKYRRGRCNVVQMVVVEDER